MQEVFEKIIEKLEGKRLSYFLTIANTGDEKLDCAYEHVGDALDKAIEIVKQEAEKRNNGWIPCSERLPKLGEVVIITTKEGLVYSDIQYDYRYNGDKFPCFHRWDSEMWQCFQPDVVAWQPLPLPFRDKE